MPRYELPELTLNNKYKRIQGISLIEVLVTLVILSILASAALPYAEIAVKRDKELELKHALREIREAIDRLHADWEKGRVSQTDDSVSEYGYPKRLETLVEGVNIIGDTNTTRYYLRRVPRDPFADQSTPVSDQWMLRSYQDEPNNISWGGQDVFDIRTKSELIGLDGTQYHDW